MSKIYFNKKVNPAITKAKHLPKTNAQTVFFSNPLTASVERLEKQNEAALNALAGLNTLVSQLAKSAQLEEISSKQQVLLDHYGTIQGQIDKEFQKLEEAQAEMKGLHDRHHEQLDAIKNEVQAGHTEVNDLKKAIKDEQVSGQLQELIACLHVLQQKQEEGVNTVLENNALQTLLLEELSRKQAELGTNHTEGLAQLIAKLNLLQTENERSHDTQLQNQKLLVDSLYKLATQQYGLELYME